jgi:hypothetical protein
MDYAAAPRMGGYNATSGLRGLDVHQDRCPEAAKMDWNAVIPCTWLFIKTSILDPHRWPVVTRPRPTSGLTRGIPMKRIGEPDDAYRALPGIDESKLSPDRSSRSMADAGSSDLTPRMRGQVWRHHRLITGC